MRKLSAGMYIALRSYTHVCWELTVPVPDNDLGGGIDQVHKFRVGIQGEHADGEPLVLFFKSAVTEDEDMGARRANFSIEIEEPGVDTVEIDVTVDSATDCMVGKEKGAVCGCE